MTVSTIASGQKVRILATAAQESAFADADPVAWSSGTDVSEATAIPVYMSSTGRQFRFRHQRRGVRRDRM